MVRLIWRRLLISIPLLMVVSGLTFFLEWITPGDVVAAILGIHSTPQEVATLRSQLGLDRPVWDQYLTWLANAVHGDFGSSLFTGETVLEAISYRLPVTLSLVIGGVLLTAILGVGVGVVAAVRPARLGKALDALSLILWGIPNFWLALLLVLVFADALRLLPATGYVQFVDSPTGWLRSLILPVVAIALGSIAGIAKQTRDAMLDVLQRDFIRNLRACGVPERSIIFKHALKNAAIPATTMLGLVSVGLLSGTVIVEAVFALPGLGSLVISAVDVHDVPIVQGVAVTFALIVVSINLLLDIIYGWLNPKVRT